MGTNYYWYKDAPCSTCGRCDKPVHVGKSSAGWCFSLHIYPDDGIQTLDDWISRFETPGTCIKNEYGDLVSQTDLLEIIRDRSWTGDLHHHDSPWYSRNNAEPGPNNLARHKIGAYCVGHGNGTWDYMEREFS